MGYIVCIQYVKEENSSLFQLIFMNHCHCQHECWFPPIPLHHWAGKWLLIQGSTGVMMEVPEEQTGVKQKITPPLSHRFCCLLAAPSGRQHCTDSCALGKRGPVRETSPHAQPASEGAQPPRQWAVGVLPQTPRCNTVFNSLLGITAGQEGRIHTQLMLKRGS